MSLLLLLARLLVSGAVHAQTLPVLDKDFACFDAATADRYVRDFKIDVRSFGGLELCDAAVDTKKLLNDLSLVENGHFDHLDSTSDLIRGFVPQGDYYNWLRQQTRGVSRGNDIPWATAYNRFGFFTMQDGWSRFSTLGRVGVVVHEARHTEGYSHTRCTSGPYANANTSGCDKDYSYGGSHAVEIEYYGRVHLKGTNFHPVYQTMARLMAMARGNFVFNKPVLKAKEAVVLLGADGLSPVLVTGEKLYPRGTLLHTGELKRTSYGASLFNGSEASAIELYKNRNSDFDLKDVYSYYKLLPENAEPLKDFEEYDVNGQRYAVEINGQDQIRSYNFPAGQWNDWKPVGFSVTRTVTRLPSGETGYFLLDAENGVHPYDVKSQKMGAVLPQAWDARVLKVAQDESGRLIHLRTDKTLWAWSSSQWVPYIDGSWTSVVNVPLYNAFEVTP